MTFMLHRSWAFFPYWTHGEAQRGLGELHCGLNAALFVLLLVSLKAIISTLALTCRTYWRGTCAVGWEERWAVTVYDLGAGLL